VKFHSFIDTRVRLIKTCITLFIGEDCELKIEIQPISGRNRLKLKLSNWSNSNL